MDLERMPWYGQLAVFTLLGLTLVAVFYFVMYQPKTGEIETMQSEVDRLDQEIRRAKQAQAKLEQLEKETIANEAQLEKLKQVLPEKQEADQTLRKIQELMITARIKLNNFTPGSMRPMTIYEEWPIPMSVEGSYHNLAIFFDNLSKLTKIFTIDGLTITPLSANQSVDRTIIATFTATTYIYKEPEAPKPQPRVPRQREEPVDQGASDKLDV